MKYREIIKALAHIERASRRLGRLRVNEDMATTIRQLQMELEGYTIPIKIMAKRAQSAKLFV
jgi:hypothetical protein